MKSSQQRKWKEKKKQQQQQHENRRREILGSNSKLLSPAGKSREPISPGSINIVSFNFVQSWLADKAIRLFCRWRDLKLRTIMKSSDTYKKKKKIWLLDKNKIGTQSAKTLKYELDSVDGPGWDLKPQLDLPDDNQWRIIIEAPSVLRHSIFLNMSLCPQAHPSGRRARPQGNIKLLLSSSSSS